MWCGKEKLKMVEFTKEQREEIKKRDGYQCQYDKVTNHSGLSGVPCSKELEVHHLVYRQGKQFLEDGITMCKRCHQICATSAVRGARYRRLIEKMDLNNKFGFNRVKIGG